MRRTILMLAGALLALASGSAEAAPGLGGKVYGAEVEKGEFELEARYGGLTGGAGDGDSALVLEAAYGFTDRLYGALLTEIVREPGSGQEVEAIAVEGIYELGRIPRLDVATAVYAEYEAGLNGDADGVELKALFQKRAGPFDGRLNLIAERPLGSGGEFEFAYAASADWEVFHDVRVGVQAFGDFGDEHGFGGRREHYIGPVAKVELAELPGGGEIEVETGYLFAAGGARGDADGQFRLLLEVAREF